MTDLLNRDTDIVAEVDRVGNVVPIECISHFRAICNKRALEEIGVLLLYCPPSPRVIFRTGPSQGGPFAVAIEIDFNLSLSPPFIKIEFPIALHPKVCSEETPFPQGPRKDLKVLLHFSWVFTPEMGMKVENAGIMFVAQGVIHVIEEKLEILTTLVGHHDFHTCPEGHGNVAVEAFPFRARKKRRLESGHLTKPEPKEVTQRCAYRWLDRSIPEHLNLQPSEHGRTLVVDRDPDPTDGATGPTDLRQRDLLSRLDRNCWSALSSAVGLSALALLASWVLRAGPSCLNPFGQSVNRLCRRLAQGAACHQKQRDAETNLAKLHLGPPGDILSDAKAYELSSIVKMRPALRPASAS